MKNKIHLMVDIETLGTNVDAVITSIGAALFNIETGEITKTFYTNVDIDSCLKEGLKVKGSTIQWWLEQPKDAVAHLFEPKPVSLQLALINFEEFIQQNDTNPPFPSFTIWAKPPRFDLAILTNAFTVCGRAIPWDFRKERCLRTILQISPESELIQLVGTTKHNALDDCKIQIAQLVDAKNRLNLNL